MQAEQLFETAINPETRNIVQLTMEDVEKGALAIDLFLGNGDADLRKEVFSGKEIF